MSDSGDSDRFSTVDILHYSPNQPAAVAAGIVFLGLSVILFYRLFRYKNWWGLCLPIGTLAFAAGFFIRLASAKDQYSILRFTLNQVLIVVSPAAFLAFNYIIYGRIIRTFAAGQKGFSWIRPDKVATIFVTSDVVAFLVQGAAGGLQSQEKSASLGRVVLLAGIIIQAISYVLFYILFIHAHRKFSTDGGFSLEELSLAIVTCASFFVYLYLDSIRISFSRMYRRLRHLSCNARSLFLCP